MNDCIHHWLIQPIDGPYPGWGICQRCGDGKQFENTIPDIEGTWNDDTGKYKQVSLYLSPGRAA